jgi:hypothetical protein
VTAATSQGKAAAIRTDPVLKCIYRALWSVVIVAQAYAAARSDDRHALPTTKISGDGPALYLVAGGELTASITASVDISVNEICGYFDSRMEDKAEASDFVHRAPHPDPSVRNPSRRAMGAA